MIAPNPIWRGALVKPRPLAGLRSDFRKHPLVLGTLKMSAHIVPTGYESPPAPPSSTALPTGGADTEASSLRRDHYYYDCL
jgi:hypothetical protein